ncbi:type II toxin-antitoxin system VapB family antitoxin [Pyrofollis japonicus]|uniref:type II toxin-antitoxin system VapB family antitoxin n=1 Tax=Pyrofollis japonicus TaxID=3060460 RepID=UPI00295AAF83|nr:CopG family transcriptional regulator [Pyrofollis japonicus]
MSVVVSFKVRKEVKELMDKYRNKINWSEELRRFVEERIRQLEAEENLEKIVSELREASWSVPRGFGEKSVREDRDSR